MNTNKGRKFLTSCCGGCVTVFLLLVVTVGFRWVIGNRSPNLVVPPKPASPTPNAFDTFRSAVQLMVNKSQIDDSISLKPDVQRTLAQKAAIVNSNAAALRMLRIGLSQEFYDPSIRSVNTNYPYYAQFRAMARLLSLEGTVRAQQGDWNGAAQSSLDCIHLGMEIPHGGPLIGALVGIACQSIGRRNLWNYLDHLDARQSRGAINQLLAIESRHVPFSDTLQEERYLQSSALNLLFKSKISMSDILGPSDDAGPPSEAYQLVYLLYSKETIADNSKKYMDQLIADSLRPYALHLPGPPVPSDPICKILMPVFAQARIKDVEAETQNGLVCLTIALHAYRLEHGRYPDSLAQLTPSYMPALPDDPFALKGPFKYKPGGSAYTLYSVGPDGIDDGGKPIDDLSKATEGNKNARYFVQLESKGDIVAGKNIW